VGKKNLIGAYGLYPIPAETLSHGSSFTLLKPDARKLSKSQLVVSAFDPLNQGKRTYILWICPARIRNIYPLLKQQMNVSNNFIIISNEKFSVPQLHLNSVDALKLISSNVREYL